MRSLPVMVHEPRIASHVGDQYRRQPALDPDWPLLNHGPQPNQAYCTTGERSCQRVLTGWLSNLTRILGHKLPWLVEPNVRVRRDQLEEF